MQDCSGLVGGALDLCEFGNALTGASETSAGGDSIGAMIGARGCITEIHAPNATPGSCQAGSYEVTVVWQGLTPTVAPASQCGVGLYGDDALRRAMTVRVGAGVGRCL